MNARSARTICVVLAVGGLVGGVGCRKKPSPRHVTINNQTWRVEVASTDEQRHTGLAGRTGLPENSGMLFIFRTPGMLEFCMRGCVVDLDVAFIGADFRVVAIHTMAVEDDLAGRTAYSSGAPAQFALEVAAGLLAKADVKVGDKVIFTKNIPDPAKADPTPGR